MTGPRFFIITNDGPRAALNINCHMGNLPPSIAVVDDPMTFALVPDGGKFLALWFGDEDAVRGWRAFWSERLDRGGLEGISNEEWDKILAWAKSPNRPDPTRVLGGQAPQAQSQTSETVPPAAEAAVVIYESTPETPITRRSRWS